MGDATSSRIGIDGDTVLARTSGVLERRTATAAVLLGDAEPIVLRGTGVAIWDAFEAPSSVAAAVVRLVATYDASAETVRAEMLPVLEELCRAHALQVVDPGSPGRDRP